MKLYRMFRLDADGKPMAGVRFGMLGVRPFDPKRQHDVKAVSGADIVRPGGGGLSVYTDPTGITLQSDVLVLCEIDTADLPAGLAEVEAGEPHYHLEPSKPMTLDQFQALLARTRDDWHPVTDE